MAHTFPIATSSWVSKAGKLKSYVFHTLMQLAIQTYFRFCQLDGLTWRPEERQGDTRKLAGESDQDIYWILKKVYNPKVG